MQARLKQILGLEWAMNGLGKPIRKKILSKKLKKKTVKIKVKLPQVNKKKPLARKRISVQTPFYHSNLKLEQKNFTPQNH